MGTEKQKEINIGKPFGLDLKLKVRTEESGSIDLYKMWDDLKTNVPVFLTTLPTPITACRRTNVQIVHYPSSSETKEMDFYLTVGYGEKNKLQQNEQNLLNLSQEEEIEQICAELAPQQVQQCQSQIKQKQQQQDSIVLQQCQEQKQAKQQQLRLKQQALLQQQQQQQYVKNQYQQQQYQQYQQQDQQYQQQYQQYQQQDQQQQNLQYQQYQQYQQQYQQYQQGNQQNLEQLIQQQFQQCLSTRQTCYEIKKICLEKLERSGMPRFEVEKVCQKKYELCKHNSESKLKIQEVLQEISEGYAVSLKIGTILRGRQQSEEREIESHVAYAVRPEQYQQVSQVTMKTEVRTPYMPKPYEVEFNANIQTKSPLHKWNIESILQGDLTTKVLIHGGYGMQGEEMKPIKASVLLLQSDKQKEFVKRTKEYELCSRDQSESRILTANCKKVRHQAASLDMVHAKLYLPKEIVQHQITQIVSEVAKLPLLPYISQRTIGGDVSGRLQEFEIEARVNGYGDILSGKVAGNRQQIIFKNVRLGNITQGILPVCTRVSGPIKFLQKLTSGAFERSCIVESGKVQTFDNLEYSYPLNDCEHVVFSEKSTRPRIMVSTKINQVRQVVKMVIQGHKYEVEIPRESRYAREGKAIIKVDGQVKEYAQ